MSCVCDIRVRTSIVYRFFYPFTSIVCVRGDAVIIDNGPGNGFDQGFNSGFGDGTNEYTGASGNGYSEGFNSGFGDGSNDQQPIGFNEGYNEGFK